jgi:two-component system alkaline phosphatase synthesis response regulator PhoP
MPNLSSGAQFKLLIVEDDTGTLQLLRSICDIDSLFDVTTATNGDDAVRMCRELQPNLELLDIMLPGRNGYSVCRVIKHDPACRGTRVLFLSGVHRDTALVTGRKAGADGFISRPFTINGIVSVVEKHLTDPESAGF